MNDGITVMVAGQERTIPFEHAVELARALNAACARHVNQRKLEVIDGGKANCERTDP